jgi:hypothetical protein
VGVIIQINLWLLIGTMIGSALWGIILYDIYIWWKYPILRIYSAKMNSPDPLFIEAGIRDGKDIFTIYQEWQRRGK